MDWIEISLIPILSMSRSINLYYCAKEEEFGFWLDVGYLKRLSEYLSVSM